MPRPRTIDDDTVLACAAALIGRVGPAHVTLARLADEVGLSPATLVQRFGSKRDLLLAVARSGTGSHARFESARAANGSPLCALADALVDTVAGIDTPATLANHLAFLQMDLQDPEFHRLALDDARVRRELIEQQLRAAVDAGELAPDVDASRLAAAVQNTFNGAMVTWAIYAEGDIQGFMREQLDVLLEPLRS